MNDNEKLIEEAAKAICEAQIEESTYGDLARAALAVFEKAHTPTDTNGYQSVGTPHTPNDDEREAMRRIIAQGSYSMTPESLPYENVAYRLVEAGFGFRRSEVLEPSGYRATLIREAREHADHYRRFDDTESLVSTLVEIANALASEPQGEPSDAPTQTAPALEVEGDAPNRATPTNDEREALATALHQGQPNGVGLDGYGVSKEDARILAEVALAAGFRRSVVPEPSDEEFRLIETAGSFREQVSDSASPGSMVDLWLRTAAALEARVKTSPAGEPSDAQEAEIAARVLEGVAADFAKPDGLGLTSDALWWWSWFAEMLGDKATILRTEAAALRAAGVGGAR